MEISNKKVYTVSQIFEILRERGLELSKATIREYVRMVEPLLRAMKSVSRLNSSSSGTWIIDGRGVIALIRFVELQGKKYKHGKKGNIDEKLNEVFDFIVQSKLFSPAGSGIDSDKELSYSAITPYLRKEVGRLQRRVSENRREIKRLNRELDKLRG